MMDKIKVVWVCHLSNSQIRQKLKFSGFTPISICRKILHRENCFDFASWNTRAITEFEKYADIELHVVSPHSGILGVQHFDINGICYHFFHSEDDNLVSLISAKLFKINKKGYRKNTRTILNIIDSIQPDIIHYIGAENPYYSESVISITSNAPLIVSLQTLLCDPDFLKNYPISVEEYNYRRSIEVAAIKKVDYVATKVEHFRKIILEQIGNVKFLDMSLAVGEQVNIPAQSNKQYDFVYFAMDISKAIDYVIEAFVRARNTHPNINLHVVGGYNKGLMEEIEKQLKSHGIESGVDFTGKLPTHDDVINEVRKSRFALLPLKIDLISGTIREAMANGLPVVTTITPATPNLNKQRENVLLSEKGDYDAMAQNMCRLLEDESLAERLRSNGMQTIKEMYDNGADMLEWRRNYYNILNSGLE